MYCLKALKILSPYLITIAVAAWGATLNLMIYRFSEIINKYYTYTKKNRLFVMVHMRKLVALG